MNSRKRDPISAQLKFFTRQKWSSVIRIFLFLITTTKSTESSVMKVVRGHAAQQHFTYNSPMENFGEYKQDVNSDILMSLRNKVGRCSCPKAAGSQSIEARYRSSFVVVRAKVIRWTEDRQFTRNGAIPQFLIRNYILQSTGLYKGRWPVAGKVFQAQGFVHGDACGLKLKIGRQYLFNLDDPKKISPGNTWRKGIFVLTRCKNHYGWLALDSKQKSFLLRRAK